MRTTRLALTAAAVVVAFPLLAGCGGSSGPSVASSSDVAKAVGCDTSFRPDDSSEMFVTDSGSCSLGGRDVTVNYFADNAQRDQWVKVATTMGGRYLVGDHFALEGPTPALEAAKGKAGGTLKP